MPQASALTGGRTLTRFWIRRRVGSMGARRKQNQSSTKKRTWVNSGLSWTVSHEPERDYRNKPAGIKALADMIAESEKKDAKREREPGEEG